jgi:3-deoxy-D-manno-octulosonate 8-phosphate phosphatase (KDO 8-P phosphatase)
MPTLAERCARIDLLVLDVDGVLTDGSIVYAGGDVEIKPFSTLDGAGLKLWRDAGKRSVIITRRSSPAVTRRAAELGIDHVMQGAEHKLTALNAVLAGAGLVPEQAAGVGDDLHDLPFLRAVAMAVAVSNACSEVRGTAHYVTKKSGGCGAVREVIELILRCQGKWQSAVRSIVNEHAQYHA